MPKPKHILVIRFSALGDVAMTVPVLRALLIHHPQLKITVVTKPFFKPLFHGLNNIEVFEADFNDKHKGLIGLYRLSKQLKALNFSEVADLHNVLRSKILKLFFTGKRVVQIDKGRAEKKALVTGKSFHQIKTTHERYADVFRNLGYSIELTNPKFPPKPYLPLAVEDLSPKDNKPLVGVAPFAAHKSKMYPLIKMDKVVQQLSKNYRVYLFGGGAKEVKALEAIALKYNNVVSVAGKLAFNDELKLIANLDVMVSMDSGNGHLAAMFGVAVITIWGVTHPFAGFAPFNQPKDNAMVAKRDQYPLIPTSIYGNKFPDGYENASGSISIDEIVSKVDEVLLEK